MNKLGFNVQAQGLSGSDRDRLVADLTANPPTTLVVIDDLSYAVRLAGALPKTYVFYRRTDVAGSGTDDNVHRRLDAVAFWRAATAGMPNLPNLGVYANNEPEFTDASIAWCIDVATIAASEGRPVVVGNFSTGTPNEAPANLQRAAELMRLSAEHPTIVFIGLHEYAVLHWIHRADAQGRVLTTPPNETATPTLWFMGRWKFWRAAVPNVAARFVITETGFDDPNGVYHGQIRCAPVWAQWGKTNAQAYAYEQLVNAEVAHYLPDMIVGLTLFTYGNVPDRPGQEWSFFNWQRWPEFMARWRTHATPVDDDEPTTLPSEPGVFVVNVGSSYLNFRTSAGTNNPAVGRIYTGDVVEVFGRAVAVGGYVWEYARFNSQNGWFARVPALTLSPVEVPPTVPLPETVTVTVLINGTSYEGTITRDV